MTYYKCVTKELNSAYAYLNEDFNVSYKINEWTYPRVDGTKLFVFDSYQNCLDWCNKNLWGDKIFKCKVSGEPERVDYLTTNYENFQKYWDKLLQVENVSVLLAPKGTYAVDSIKLIQRVG